MLTTLRSAGMSLAILAVCIGAGLFGSVRAHGFVLKRDDNGVHLEVPAALCIASADGRVTKLVAAGSAAPGGGTISYIGTPALANDGSVVFAALIGEPHKTEWKILRANVTRPDHIQIDLAIADYTATPDCQPVLKTDPYVIADGDGAIVFVADRRGGGGALFRYDHGRMECEVRTGERTADGNLIASIGFGSARAIGNGATVLRVGLVSSAARSNRSDRNAIVLVTRGAQAREIAVQGNRSRDGARYGAQFGLPAISLAGDRVIVAFTNRTNAGDELFVGPPEEPARAIGAGSLVGGRAITYLSDGRPGLDSDGSVAVEGAAGRHRLIIVVRDGEPSMVASEKLVAAPGDDRVDGVGEPIANVSGRIYAESIDDSGNDRISLLPGSASGAQPMAVVRDVFPSSSDVDRSGKIVFLASQPIDEHAIGGDFSRSASLPRQAFP